MGTQDHQPAGWYPDPAGQGQRYWDGALWRQAEAPAKRPRKSRPWIVMLWVVAIIGSLCVAICFAPGWKRQHDIGTAADAVAILEFNLVYEQWIGNAYCLDYCLELHRRYSSPFSPQETFRLLTSALQAAGFQCSSCEGFDRLGNSLSTTWTRSDRKIILGVFTSANAVVHGRLLSVAPLDATRQVHADVMAS